jgi:hypothetical protein
MRAAAVAFPSPLSFLSSPNNLLWYRRKKKLPRTSVPNGRRLEEATEPGQRAAGASPATAPTHGGVAEPFSPPLLYVSDPPMAARFLAEETAMDRGPVGDR